MRYRGGDPDSERLRRSAARYVGLEMPAAAPLAPASGPEAFATKYAAPLAARVGDLSGLSGVEHLKAQLYGADFREERPAGEGTGAYKPLGGGGGGGSGGGGGASPSRSLREAITSGPAGDKR